MKKILPLWILLFLSIGLHAQEKSDSIRALFIGNSYTAYNAMVYMLKEIAQSQGKNLAVKRLTRGGAYMHQLIERISSITALKAIQSFQT